MFYSFWDIECDRLKLVFVGNFLAFTSPPLKTPKTEFGKNEKNCWRYHHFTRVPKTTNIWGTVPEIQSETDRIFCHFCRFNPLRTRKIKILKNEKNICRCNYFTPVYQNHDLVPEIRKAKDRIFSHFGSFFALLPP